MFGLDPLAGLVGQQKKDGKERAMEKTIAILERGKTVDVRVRFVEWHGKAEMARDALTRLRLFLHPPHRPARSGGHAD